MTGWRSLLVATVLLATGCHGDRPGTPTTLPTPTGPSAGPTRPPGTFQINGDVTDDANIPVPGATVKVVLDDYEGSGPSVVTDGAGRYSMSFAGVPGALTWPEGMNATGTENAVGMAVVTAHGFEPHASYVLGVSAQIVQNVRLRRLQRITLSESVVVTITPDDTLCAGDVYPLRAQVCRSVYVVVPGGGFVHLEAAPLESGAPLPGLYAAAADGSSGGRGNPMSFRVSAGSDAVVRIFLPWGSASQSFIVKTSKASRR